MRRTALMGLAGLLTIATLIACGKQGDLDRPGPLWGPKARADYAAQKRAQAAAASNATESNQAIPEQNPAIAPFTTTAPVNEQPIPGERTLPSGSSAGQQPQ